ncbi:NADPH-dependent F420 reductase [Nakamurella deserti]|uniref:NADPH-dependent F420 reductase n=1 Tax=Nakamurella deserti TaxID=2164074 RepID=UPI000DBE8899|nr:NAD(P)-binding domain-containing protein [Nakamurella deserti]
MSPTTRIHTTIAVLGAGRVGSNLATGLSGAGHRIVLGVRQPDVTRGQWAGSPVTVTDTAAAITAAELVINATPGDTTLERLSVLRDALAGRVLLDVANATTRTPDGMPGGLLYEGSSLGAQLQAALPHTRVVKSLNTMLFSVMTSPAALAAAPTAFLSGDDITAKTLVRDVLHSLGWADRWLVDLGPISTARGPEAMALMVPALLGAFGFTPFALSVAR